MNGAFNLKKNNKWILLIIIFFLFKIYIEPINFKKHNASSKSYGAFIKKDFSDRALFLLLNKNKPDLGYMHRFNPLVISLLSVFSSVILASFHIIYYKSFQIDLRDKIRKIYIWIYNGGKYKGENFFS